MTDQVFLGSDIAVGHNNWGPKSLPPGNFRWSPVTFGGP